MMFIIFFIAQIRQNIQILTELKPLGDDDMDRLPMQALQLTIISANKSLNWKG